MKLKIKTRTPATRCEICHKSDSFDPKTNHCTRCSGVVDAQIQQNANPEQRPAVRQRSFPAFLEQQRSVSNRFIAGLTVGFIIALIVVFSILSAIGRKGTSPIATSRPRSVVQQPIQPVQSIPAPAVRQVPYLSHFFEAAKNGDIEEVTRLIDSAYLNERDQNGMTPLILASQNGHTDIVKILIKAGANLEARNRASGTALMCAADQGHTQTVLTLIEAAAVTEEIHLTGATALMWAALQGHTDTVRAMIGAGANPNAKDNAGASALTYAMRKGRQETAQVLREAGAN